MMMATVITPRWCTGNLPVFIRLNHTICTTFDDDGAARTKIFLGCDDTDPQDVKRINFFDKLCTHMGIISIPVAVKVPTHTRMDW
jgi:hypothetical protein